MNLMIELYKMRDRKRIKGSVETKHLTWPPKPEKTA